MPAFSPRGYKNPATTGEINDPAFWKTVGENQDARWLEAAEDSEQAKQDALAALATLGTVKQEATAAKTAAQQSASSAIAAQNAATDAGDTAERFGDDVELLKQMAEISPGSVTDAQTALLIQDQQSETHARLNAQTAVVVGGQIEYLTYPPPVEQFYSGLYRQTLPKFSAAVDAVMAGTRDAKILVIGDSTSAGQGAANPGGYMGEQSWPSFMVDELNRAAIRTAHGIAVPPRVNFTDARFTLGSGWLGGNTATDYGFGGRKGAWYRGNALSGGLTFTDPRVVWDRADIYYLQYNSPPELTATLHAQATGGAVVEQSTGMGSGAGGLADNKIVKATVSAATASPDNVVTIRNTGTDTGRILFIMGIELHLSTTRKVRVGNAAVSGTATADWLRQSSATVEWSSRGSIRAYDPDLLIIDLGINDSASTIELPVAEYRANLLAIAAFAPNADVVFKTFIPSSGDATRTALQEQYVAAMKDLGPSIDFYGRYGSYEDTAARGWMADNTHGNATLYREEGVAFATALRELVRR